MKTVYLLTNLKPDKISFWSGIPYYCREVLQQHFKVVEICPGETLLAKLSNALFIRFKKYLGFGYNYHHSFISAIVYWPYILYNLGWKYRKQSGIVVALGVSPELLFIPSKYRIVLFCDAIFAQLREQRYVGYTQLVDFSIKESMYVDQLAYSKANHIIFTSNWSRNRAISDYNIDSDRTSIHPFGANIIDSFHAGMIQSRIENETISILFNCSDWQRKGGEAVILFAKHLSSHSPFKVELDILGDAPEVEGNNNFKINLHGWLRKNNKHESIMLSNIYSKADFMILPSMADCTPVAISESYCYGIPVIASPVGGIEELIFKSSSGYIFSPKDPEPAVKWLLEHVKNEKYTQASTNVRNAYEHHFSWTSWLDHLTNILFKL